MNRKQQLLVIVIMNCGLTVPLFHYYSSCSVGPLSDTVIAVIVTFFATLAAFLFALFLERIHIEKGGEATATAVAFIGLLIPVEGGRRTSLLAFSILQGCDPLALLEP